MLFRGERQWFPASDRAISRYCCPVVRTIPCNAVLIEIQDSRYRVEGEFWEHKLKLPVELVKVIHTTSMFFRLQPPRLKKTLLQSLAKARWLQTGAIILVRHSVWGRNSLLPSIPCEIQRSHSFRNIHTSPALSVVLTCLFSICQLMFPQKSEKLLGFPLHQPAWALVNSGYITFNEEICQC